MALKSGFFLTLCLFTLQANSIKDLSRDHLSVFRNVKPSHFRAASKAARHLSAVRDSLILNRLRVKRSALFSTGVRACLQENMAEVIASHKSYYILRVCQEAVWEAFQIFLDRVPDTAEFQQWVDVCQTQSLCVEDMALNFSNTQEHLDMVARRLSIQDNQEHAMVTSISGSKSPGEKNAMDLEKNKVSAVLHKIKLSVTVKGSDYIQLHKDPDNVQYQDIIDSHHEQILQIFPKLAGFKEIRLLGIQVNSPGSVTLHYTMVFETEVNSTGTGASGTVREFSPEIALRDKILKALKENPFLPLDIISFNVDATTQNHVKGLVTNRPIHLPEVISTKAAYIISQDTTESINISEEDAAPNGAQGRDEVSIFPPQDTNKDLPTVNTLVTIPETSPAELSSGPKLKETEEQNLVTKAKGYKRNTSLDSPSKVSEVEQAIGNEIAAMPTAPSLNFMKAVRASTSHQYSDGVVAVSEASVKKEISVMPYFTQIEVPKAEEAANDNTAAMDGISETPEASSFSGRSEVPSTNQPMDLIRFSLVPMTEGTIQHMQSVSSPQTVSTVDMLTLPSAMSENFLNNKGESIQTHSPHQAETCDNQKCMKGWPSETANPQSSVRSLDKDVRVFFSLQFTNIMFSEDLFNRSSSGYKSLEDTFLELKQISGSNTLPNSESSSKQETEKEPRILASIPLLQLLQSDLNGIKELHILNFRNGSVVVKRKFEAKPVVDNITNAVRCTPDILMASNAASGRRDTTKDKAEHDDPCKYMDCNEFSHCVVNTLTTETECLCDPGYSTVDGLPCKSICNLQPNYCLNGGLCENIPGQGVSCRCPEGKYWYFDGERCSELMSVPVEPVIFVLCLIGSLTVVCAVFGLLVFINRKWTRKAGTLVHLHSNRSMEGIMRVNPVFENDDGILTHVSSISYPTFTDSSSSQFSDQGSFYSLENMHLSIEIPRQLYTTRSEKMVSELVGFHHCIPHVQTWRLSNEHRGPDRDGFEVTVL